MKGRSQESEQIGVRSQSEYARKIFIRKSGTGICLENPLESRFVAPELAEFWCGDRVQNVLDGAVIALRSENSDRYILSDRVRTRLRDA